MRSGHRPTASSITPATPSPRCVVSDAKPVRRAGRRLCRVVVVRPGNSFRICGGGEVEQRVSGTPRRHRLHYLLRMSNCGLRESRIERADHQYGKSRITVTEYAAVQRISAERSTQKSQSDDYVRRDRTRADHSEQLIDSVMGADLSSMTLTSCASMGSTGSACTAAIAEYGKYTDTVDQWRCHRTDSTHDLLRLRLFGKTANRTAKVSRPASGGGTSGIGRSRRKATAVELGSGRSAHQSSHACATTPASDPSTYSAPP
ncbi:hypothetical protein ABH922_003749 [Rhodococcus sp. 27YEA15]